MVVKTRWMNNCRFTGESVAGEKTPLDGIISQVEYDQQRLNDLQEKKRQKICRMQKSRQSGIIRSNRNAEC